MEEGQKEYEEVEITFSVQSDLITTIPDKRAEEMLEWLAEICEERDK